MATKKNTTVEPGNVRVPCPAWTDTALNKLVMDLKAVHSNSNVSKFPRYRKQYKGVLQ